MENTDLLKTLKLSLGDLNATSDLDDYYLQKINQAKSDLATDDIDETQLNSELGQNTIVLYATLLIQDKEIATNPTLLYLRNRLSDLTKGARHKTNV